MVEKLKKLDNTKIILITGSAGFIGFHLSRSLLEKGFRVIGFDNLNDYYDVELKNARVKILTSYSDFTFIKGDIADRASIEKVFQESRPDIIVNLAAQAGVRYSIDNPDAYISSNVIGFFNILECCRNYKIEHLIFASSSSVYGANKKVPFSTDDNVDKPVSLYAATKKSNELMAYSYSHLYGFPSTGLRFFTVYGPYGRPDMAYFSFTKAIMDGNSIKVFNHGDLYRDFTYIDDIVIGIEKIISTPPKPDENNVKHKVYNIGNNKPVKLMDFINTLERYLGKVGNKEYYPMQPGDVYKTYADIEDLKHDFGFKPSFDIEKGLHFFVDWYKAYYKI